MDGFVNTQKHRHWEQNHKVELNQSEIYFLSTFDGVHQWLQQHLHERHFLDGFHG